MSYEIGSLIRIGPETFTNLDGDPVDPSSVSLLVRDPLGAVATHSGGAIIREALGQYHFDLTVTTAGRWSYRWTGTGAAAAVAESAFYVRDSMVLGTTWPAVTLGQARGHLNFDDTDDEVDDDELQFFVDSANAWVAKKVAAADLVVPTVQLATLDLVRSWWQTQRGPMFAGTPLSGDDDVTPPQLQIPGFVWTMIEPWTVDDVGLTPAAPTGSFPPPSAWPDPVDRCLW